MWRCEDVVGATLEVQNPELGKEGEKVERGRLENLSGFLFLFFLETQGFKGLE